MSDETKDILDDLLTVMEELYEFWSTVDEVQLGYHVALGDFKKQINILKEQRL